MVLLAIDHGRQVAASVEDDMFLRDLSACFAKYNPPQLSDPAAHSISDSIGWLARCWRGGIPWQVLHGYSLDRIACDGAIDVDGAIPRDQVVILGRSP